MKPFRMQPGAGVISDRPKPAFTVSPRTRAKTASGF